MIHTNYKCRKCGNVFHKKRDEERHTDENLRCTSCRSRDKEKIYEVSDRSIMENENLNILNEDCIEGSGKLEEASVDLFIGDPPFGIQETQFQKHYKRNDDKVLEGYQEAPENYAEWTHAWMEEARRLLKDDGSMYVISGHTNLRHILNAAADLGLHEINHIIWKFNFGVNTKKKFVTSHYHVLYYSKSSKANPTFNTNCRFGSHEKTKDGKSLLYRDIEDVFDINKEYSPNGIKNQNKLPEELIRKLILYSSHEGDTVCDFFMGNFTTASAALKLGRKVCGFEINEIAYTYHMSELSKIEFGKDLGDLKVVENKAPKNQGKKVTEDEAFSICKDYLEMVENQKMKKKDVSVRLQEKYQRGRFSIKNILDKSLPNFKKVPNTEIQG